MGISGKGMQMTEWDYIFERDWNKYSINAILERKKDDTKSI